jgi:hypothetical protein
MFLLSQTNGLAHLIGLLPLLTKLKNTVSSWTNAEVLKQLYESVPRETAVSRIYFRRYLELVAWDALQKARACGSLLELQMLINSVDIESIEAQAYCFIQETEKNIEEAQVKALLSSSEEEVERLLRFSDPDSAERALYELKWTEMHLR